MDWLARSHSNLRELARILGLLQSICDIFLWGQAQLLILQQLLAVEVKKAYNLARADRRVHNKYINERAKLPQEMIYRL